MSTIHIHALRQALKLGCSAEERSHPQVVEFDIEMTIDTKRAASTDDLNDSVDYVAVIRLIEEHTCSREWKLVEKLCTDLALVILEAQPMLKAITVSAKKNILPNSAGFSAKISVSR